jgi:hypothetical protein
MTNMTQWFYQNDETTLGPYSANEIKRLGDDGVIAPDTPVRKGADGKWIRAQSVKGLFPTSEERVDAPKQRPELKSSEVTQWNIEPGYYEYRSQLGGCFATFVLVVLCSLGMVTVIGELVPISIAIWLLVLFFVAGIVGFIWGFRSTMRRLEIVNDVSAERWHLVESLKVYGMSFRLRRIPINPDCRLELVKLKHDFGEAYQAKILGTGEKQDPILWVSDEYEKTSKVSREIVQALGIPSAESEILKAPAIASCELSNVVLSITERDGRLVIISMETEAGLPDVFDPRDYKAFYASKASLSDQMVTRTTLPPRIHFYSGDENMHHIDFQSDAEVLLAVAFIEKHVPIQFEWM